MSTNAVLTNGTIIAREDPATPGTYVAIGSVSDFTPPGRQRSAVDVTTLGDTVKKAKAGVKDNGEFSFEVVFDKADVGHADVEADFDAGDEHNYKLTLNNGPTPTTRIMPCIVTGFKLTGGGIDSPIKAQVTLKVVGAIS
jgi:hypothetical protein